MSDSIPPPKTINQLTPRQLEIIALLAEEYSNKNIATILSISGETVKKHIFKARRKMNLENRIQLIVMFVMWRERKSVTNP